ncbi:hypothetical protein JXR93_03120 [bacterium]|nr:hypothetical protein [bacterium]
MGQGPIITSISAQIQGRYQQIHGMPLKASDMRAILSNTDYSYPQTGDLTKHIGPFPNIKLIFQKYFGDTESCMNISCESWETCSNGACVTPAGRCNSDSQCASNQVCSSDHYCRTSSSGTGGVSTGTVTNGCSISTSQSAINPFLLMLSVLALFTMFIKRKISK